MVNLVTESETIPVKDAIAQVNRNIFYLQAKLRNARQGDPSFQQIQKFYEDKIDAQRAALGWLKNSVKVKVSS